MAYQEMLEQMSVNVLGILQNYECSTLYNIVYHVGLWCFFISLGLVLLLEYDTKKLMVARYPCAASFIIFMLIFNLSPDINKDTIWTEPSYKSYIIEAVDDTETLKELYKSFEAEDVDLTLQSKYKGLNIMKVTPKDNNSLEE